MCKFKPLACGYHSHTDLSLDGGTTPKNKIIYADSIGRIADCVTDHGLMSGLVPHWNASKELFKKGVTEKEIKSIHGIEAYVIDPHRPPKIRKKDGVPIPQYYHLTIHFKTKEAYYYFCRLTPSMIDRHIVKVGEVKALMTFEELEKISGQIVIGSGCLLGPVQQNVLRGNFDLAEKMYNYLRDVAGPDNFFVEVFPHAVNHNWKRAEVDRATKKIITPGKFEPITSVRSWEGAEGEEPEVDSCTGSLDIQKAPNEFVLQMAKKYGDPVVISLDDHFGPKEDKLVQDVRLGNGQEQWKFYNVLAALESNECAKVLKEQLNIEDKQIEEWIDNSYKFVDKFNDYTLETSEDRWLLPTVEMVYGKEQNSLEKFWELVKKHDRLPKEDDPQYQVYMERINYELSVLADNGVADFLPYFFVLEDAAEWGKKTGNLWNTRGSAGGSLALYAIGVSITDPIKYELPFERFLTLERIKGGSLPDVDYDCEDREVMNEYLKGKYGDSVSLISTNLQLRLKSSILDVERSMLGQVRDSTAYITKRLKIPTGDDDKKWLYGYTDKAGSHVDGFWDNKEDPLAEELRQYAENNKEIWDKVQRCIGITKAKGVHAGGVIITPGPVQNYLPLIQTKKGVATAYDMHGDESVGAVKYDFLGLGTLKALSISMKSIKELEGVDLKWEEWPHDDDVINEVIYNNKLATIFQINTDTVRPFVNSIRPKNVLEIAALTSLVRPGALGAPSPDPKDREGFTAADYYVACAQGNKKPYYIHEDIVDVLKETHGVPIFQEQLMEIGVKCAGYSLGDADLIIRKGVGKKIKAKVEQFSNDLRKVLPGRGWDNDQIDKLIDIVMAAARYSFNKAHATSYAIVAYNCCWLKHHYPVHYWKGMLTDNVDEYDKLVKMLPECRNYLLDVDIRKSHPEEWMIEEGKIRPPLSLLKGCGHKGVTALKNFIDGVQVG